MTSVPATLPPKTSRDAPTPALLSAAEVARRMSPTDMPNLITEGMVIARMRSKRWPSTKVGRGARCMTPAQVQEALDIEAIDATWTPPQPSASGLTTKSQARHQNRRKTA